MVTTGEAHTLSRQKTVCLLTDRRRSRLSRLIEEHNDDPSAVLDLIAIVRDSVFELISFLDYGLEAAREDILRDDPNRGIRSLPFEIMERILQFAYGPLDEGWRNLLLVNRHFRDVTCSASHLWTAVDVACDPAPYLERSASRGLLVSADDIHLGNVKFERWINAIDPHLERWKSFSIRSTPKYQISNERKNLIGDPKMFVHERLCRLRDAYRGRTFPSLETLSVSYGVDVPVDLEAGVVYGVVVLGNDNDPHASTRNFFSTWDMPALRNLEMGGFIPMLPQACASNITRFKLKLGDPRRANRLVYNLRVIKDFLRSLISLEDLHFDLNGLNGMIRNDVQPVHLSCLKNLAVYADTTLTQVLAPLIISILAPELRELTLDVEPSTNEQAGWLVNHLFPDSKPRFQKLESLSCCLKYGGKGNCAFLDRLFRRLPRLRHLTITHWAHHWPRNFALHEYFSSPGCSVPPLRTLRFVLCEKLNLAFILKCLRDVIGSPEFETLEIRDCPLINMEILRRAMPKGKRLKGTDFNWCMSRLYCYGYVLY